MKTECLFALFTALSLNCDETFAQPSIDYQPRSQTVILYQPTAFGVIASGIAPLGYQWRKEDVPIPGATNDQIVLQHPQFSDAGQYSVVVSNAEGSVTSADAVLTVHSPKAGDLDCSFACGGVVIDGDVTSVVVQPNGRVLIAECILRGGGAAYGRIRRLNANGSTDYTFMNGLTDVGSEGGYSQVSSVALQNDGKVLLGGDFSTVNGIGRTNIARLNPDGTLDGGFLAEADGPVLSVQVQRDGKVLISGLFGSVNGVRRDYIARLDADGMLDPGFQSGFGGVSSIAVQTDDKVLVGGDGIARLNSDGSLDSTFQVATNMWVSSIAVQTDGKVLIGGSFTAVNGVSRTNIARLYLDGALDTSFQSVSQPGFAFVSAVAVQGDGKVLIGGYFSKGIARLNTDGTLDGGFESGVAPIGGNFGGAVHSVATQSDGKVLVGGRFLTVNGEIRSWIARLNADGSLENGFPNEGGPNASVKSVAVQRDGKVLIGGGFTRVNGVRRHWIARLNEDGTLDAGFQSGLSGLERDYSGYVNSVAVQSDGKVLVGGYFYKTNDFGVGPDYYNIMRLNADGMLDNSFQDALGNNQNGVGAIYSVAVQADGKALLGGEGGIARLNSDGTLDGGFQARLSGAQAQSPQVESVAVQSDGKVLIGGYFNTVNGINRTNIARLNADGSLDNSFQNGLSGVGAGSVISVVVQSDGKVLIGGYFNTVNGISRTNIARLNADGTLDTAFQNGLSGAQGDDNPFVYSVAVQSDGKVIIGGGFTTVNGVACNGIARLNADGTLDNSFQNGLSGTTDNNGFDMGYAYSVALQSDGKVLIGGSSTTVIGVPAAYVARLYASGDTPPQLKSIARSGADVNLSWYAITNRTYRVQYSGNLSADNWTDLAGDVLATGDTASKTDTTLGSVKQRFYRVRLLP